MQWTHSRFDDGETVDPISSEVRVSARTPQTGMEPLHDVTESMLDSRYRVDSRQVRPDRHSQSDTEVEVTTSEFVDAQIAEGGPLMPLNCTQFDESPWIQTDDVNYPTLRVDDNWASYYHPSTISTIVYEPQRISIPCSCVIRDTKLAFPSKLSMVDASRISHGHSHARNRNTSMENVRWEQYETELERSGRNSDETGETGSLTEGSAEDRKNTPYDVEPHATFDYGAKREDIPGNQRPLSLVDKSCAISDAKTENSGSRDTERSFYSEVL
ncbi:unnamed protein product [Dicrocoelium dendriticum]|nr:unnamed protein product [Dicrocoelium dendriticum]